MEHEKILLDVGYCETLFAAYYLSFIEWMELYQDFKHHFNLFMQFFVNLYVLLKWLASSLGEHDHFLCM